LRFNFPYRTEGRQRPDSQRVLESAWLETVKWLRNQTEFPLDRLVAGGKSMGARVVSQLAGAGRLEAEGFAFWGYPLHPPGRKNQLRDAHLDLIQKPLLFVTGTRDTFCDMALLKGVVSRLGRQATLEIVEGGDHSFPFAEVRGVFPAGCLRPYLDPHYERILSITLAGSLTGTCCPPAGRTNKKGGDDYLRLCIS
jgi:predicted alpha/beta-hydrolase family hydrolase